MRAAKPWYRRQNDTWYVCLRGKQIPLAKGKRSKREADEAFHRLMVVAAVDAGPPGHAAISVGVEKGVGVSTAVGVANDGRSLEIAVLLDQFLDWVQQNLDCYEWHRRFIQEFANACGGLTVEEIKPIHVTNWLAKKKSWGPTTRNRVIGVVKQVFNWGVEQGLIESNPVVLLKKPTAKQRERILTATERATIWESIPDQAFRDFVLALEETGARPGEIRAVTAANVDVANGVWVLTKHKTAKKTRRPRVIYLTPAMRELTERLMSKHPEGPLFRSKFGQPWSNNAIRIRFRRLREQFPELKDVVAYCYRHTFATDGLVKGVPIATVAELLGHRSTAMIEEHYGHLAKERTYLHQAALTVTQRKQDGCA